MAQELSHKRIAKNTMALYVRGLVSVVIGLFTSRVVIDALGVGNYGVYNVAGGFVGMLGFLNAAMSGATSRFITYELGLGDRERTKATFANTLMVHILIALAIVAVCEIVGVWFLNNKLNIPADRMYAANWVFQLSVISSAIGITQVPYTALMVSHERMGVYAYVEMVNMVLKLVIVYLLVVMPGDKLIIYATLLAIVGLGTAMFYRLYCLRHFGEARTGPKYDKAILKPILSFSGWDLFGNMCVTARNQGTTFLLNIFFGVAINGAASIAAVINGVISGFAFSILNAIRPQITINYAKKNWYNFQKLIEYGAMGSGSLLSMMAIPLVLETNFVFGAWLGQVPEWVVTFSRITIFTICLNQFNVAITTGIHATGHIKRISFLSGSLYVLTLILIYIALKLGATPPWTFIITMIMVGAILLSNTFILQKQVPDFSGWKFVGRLAMLPVYALPAFIICSIIHYSMPQSFLRFIFVCITSVSLVGVAAFIFVLNKHQREQVLEKIVSKLHINLRKKDA